jgi:hypothetical protein
MPHKIAKTILSAVSILALAVPSNAQEHPTTINLSKLGYPLPSCDFMFFDKAGHPKKRVEFLDSQHPNRQFSIIKILQSTRRRYPVYFR